MRAKLTGDARKAALGSYIEAGPADLRQVCEKLIRTPHLNVVALRGLSKFEDAGPAIAHSDRRHAAIRRSQPECAVVCRLQGRVHAR